jgi:broad specificity phosphatase PhoE
MGKIMLVRHANKGNGKNAPKNHLSPEGEIYARELGKNLPESMKDEPITCISGSIHSRTIHTALLIALGAGADPKVLTGRPELGSEKQFREMAPDEVFNKAVGDNNGNVMLATRSIMSPHDYSLLQNGMVQTVLGYEGIDGNIILGTHNPYIQMLYEAITGAEYNGNAKELSYVIVEVSNNAIKLIETDLPTNL